MDGGQDRETGDIFTADVKQETNGIGELLFDKFYVFLETNRNHLKPF